MNLNRATNPRDPAVRPGSRDAALLEKARAGDSQALGEIYSSTYQEVWHTVHSLIKNEDDALDALQACNTNVGALKEKFGKQLTFCDRFNTNGVLDVVGVSPEEIKAEYRRVIDLLAPGGSYVIYPIGLTFGFVGPFLEEHFQYGMGFYANPANR